MAKAAASVLGLNGEDSDIEAAGVLARIVREINDQIAKIDADEETKRFVRERFKQFKGLGNLGGVNQPVKNARGSILKAEVLNELLAVHATLSGHFRMLENPELNGIASDLRKMAEQLGAMDAPVEIREYLYGILSNVATILDGIDVFGPEYAERKIQEMIGALAMKGGAIKEAEPKYWEKLKNKLSQGGRAVQAAARTTDAIDRIGQSDIAKNVVDFLGNGAS
ncbi:hypothetical protein [Citreimonas salinaria]|uniref:hypothetical protein n=1 Tax=Citreimonas salinaria TaxID=321339 RepID=UPI00115FF486|nr:hypothetical protein [Citreimonas salinaria]